MLLVRYFSPADIFMCTILVGVLDGSRQPGLVGVTISLVLYRVCTNPVGILIFDIGIPFRYFSPLEGVSYREKG